MAKALINGANIYYESYGTGFPLIFAYGLGGSCREWDDQIPTLSKRYRFIIWDPRGHGKSDSPRDQVQYGWQVSVEDLHGLLNHLEIDKAYVGGQSMGGGIAARFAVAYPQRVAALMLIDSMTASGLPFSAEMNALHQRIAELAETEGMEAATEYSIAANPNAKLHGKDGPEASERVRQMFLALDPIGYANTIRAIHIEDDLTQHLPQITAPTLVLAGDRDPSGEAAHFSHTKIPGSHYVVIPGAGHLANIDKPEEFNNHILEFLKTVEAGVTA